MFPFSCLAKNSDLRDLTLKSAQGVLKAFSVLTNNRCHQDPPLPGYRIAVFNKSSLEATQNYDPPANADEDAVPSDRLVLLY